MQKSRRRLIWLALCSLLWACEGGSGGGGSFDASPLDGGGDVDAGSADGDAEASTCGDGVVEPGEGCDDGEDNADLPDVACRTDCQPRRCGDAVVDTGEECDDGNPDSGDGCSATCTLEPPCGAVPVAGVALAMDAIFVGDTDWLGAPVADAWELFGEDLDGLPTTATDFTGSCQPSSGANPAAVLADGPAGLDNAFGRSVVPMLLTVDPFLSGETNADITAGLYTVALLIEPLLGPDQADVVANVYGGAELAAPPVWDGLDCWPVLQEDLSDPNAISSALAQYLHTNVTNNLWESGPEASLTVRLRLNGVVLPLTLHQARMTLQLDASHTSGSDGSIVGVLHTEELVEAVRDTLGAADPSLCSGAIWQSVSTQIRQASDILSDGTQDPASTCDGITIGLGFTMAQVRLGEIAPPVTPPSDPCP